MTDLLEKREVVVFENGELKLEVTVTPDMDTVWLTLEQISDLFQRDRSVIGKHIRNIYKEGELDEKTSGQILPGSHGITNRPPKVYNLDVIISVGYRVKSKNGILFRKWANNILKSYLLKGYVINDRHFQDIDYITHMLEAYKVAGGQLPTSDSMLEFLKAYQRGFKILDDYDHHTLSYPKGQEDTYVIEYKECIDLIHQTMFSDKGDQFAIEKDNSFQSSIATIYQSFGGTDLYPTIEDKASALLYLIVKNHSFVDGNKRIGATIFLYFLEKNNSLFKDHKKRINEDALATLTILVASSRPEDKDIIMDLIKTILN
ncbi:MAG: RhuM family protein [Longibaculum sp.]